MFSSPQQAFSTARRYLFKNVDWQHHGDCLGGSQHVTVVDNFIATESSNSTILLRQRLTSATQLQPKDSDASAFPNISHICWNEFSRQPSITPQKWSSKNLCHQEDRWKGDKQAVPRLQSNNKHYVPKDPLPNYSKEALKQWLLMKFLNAMGDRKTDHIERRIELQTKTS